MPTADAIEDCLCVWEFMCAFRGSEFLPTIVEGNLMLPECKLEDFAKALLANHTELQKRPHEINPHRFVASLHIGLLKVLLQDASTDAWWPKPKSSLGARWWQSHNHEVLLQRDLSSLAHPSPIVPFSMPQAPPPSHRDSRPDSIAPTAAQSQPMPSHGLPQTPQQTQLDHPGPPPPSHPLALQSAPLHQQQASHPPYPGQPQLAELVAPADGTLPPPTAHLGNSSLHFPRGQPLLTPQPNQQTYHSPLFQSTQSLSAHPAALNDPSIPPPIAAPGLHNGPVLQRADLDRQRPQQKDIDADAIIRAASMLAANVPIDTVSVSARQSFVLSRPQDTLYRAAIAIGAPNDMLRECAMRQQPAPALLQGIAAAAAQLDRVSSRPGFPFQDQGQSGAPMAFPRFDDATVKAATEAAERHLRAERNRLERAQAERELLERVRMEQYRRDYELSRQARSGMGRAADAAVAVCHQAVTQAAALAAVAAACSDDVSCLSSVRTASPPSSQAIAAASLVLTALQMRGARTCGLDDEIMHKTRAIFAGGRKRRGDAEMSLQEVMGARGSRGSRGGRGSRGQRSARGSTSDKAAKRQKYSNTSYAPMKVNELVTLLKLDLMERVVPRPPIDAVRPAYLDVEQLGCPCRSPQPTGLCFALYSQSLGVARNHCCNNMRALQAAAARLADRFDEHTAQAEDSVKSMPQNGGAITKPLRGKESLRTAIEHILRGHPYGGLTPKCRCALLRVLVDASLRTTFVRYCDCRFLALRSFITQARARRTATKSNTSRVITTSRAT